MIKSFENDDHNCSDATNEQTNKVTNCHAVNFENRALFKSYFCNQITLRKSGALPENTGAILNHFYVSNSFGSSCI